MDRMQKIHEKYAESGKERTAIDSEVVTCANEVVADETVVSTHFVNL